tara:strand:- start:409 stop:1743 length:1335 start_codon:yes stop_codon:yes gene_type:complete
MEPSNKLLDEFSDKLGQAVALTLKLGADEKIFVGNEERMFLYALLQRLPDYSLKTSKGIQNSSQVTNHNFHDIWKKDIQNTSKIKLNLPLQDRFRSWAIAIRRIILRAISLISLKYELRNASTLIHYSAHMRYGNFVTPELTGLYFRRQDTKDAALRQSFSQHLASVKFSSILVDYITVQFPTSHLESYRKLSTHPITQLKIGTVAATIFGIMSDPLLSFLVKSNSSKLIYVQHGGGYGLNKDHLGHQMEDSGSDLMYYWGTGDKNVFPTRYRSKHFARMNKSSMIILSNQKDLESTRPYIELANTVSKKWQSNCVVCIHPDSPIFGYKNVRHGTRVRAHEKAQLVVYDNILHSLMYQRILARRPFLVIDSDVNDLRVHCENGRKLLRLMRESKQLVSSDKLQSEMNYWMELSPNEAQIKFRKRGYLVFDHILNQPKLESVLGL